MPRCRPAAAHDGASMLEGASYIQTDTQSHARVRGCTHAHVRARAHTRKLTLSLTHTSRTSMFVGRRLPCARPSRCRYPSPSAAHAVCLHRRRWGRWGVWVWVRLCARGGARVRMRVGQTGQSPPGLAEARRA